MIRVRVIGLGLGLGLGNQNNLSVERVHPTSDGEDLSSKQKNKKKQGN